MKQMAAYGKLGPDAVEPVGGWYCIRVVDIPARDGKAAFYGNCVAMAESFEMANLMAASPELRTIAEMLVSLDEVGSSGSGFTLSDVTAKARAIIDRLARK